MKHYKKDTKAKAKLVLATMLSSVLFSVQAETIDEVISATLKTHPDILAATSQQQAVSKQVDQARAGYFPTVDLAVGTGWESTDSPTTRALGRGEVHRNRDEASLNVRQMLFDGMETKNEVRRQKARTESSASSAYSVAENTSLEAIDVYLNVLHQQDLVELAQTNLEAHQRIHDQIYLRSQRGVGRGSDMDQIKGRLALAEANLMEAEGNLRDAQTNFQRVVGFLPESLQHPEPPFSLIPETLDEAVATSFDTHPTLKQAEYDVESAKAQHDTAKAPYYPDVHLELGGRSDHSLDGSYGYDNELTAMIRLRYNIYNGGRDTARREETAYLINQAAEIRNNTRRQVEESVRLSWNSWETFKRQVVFRQQHVDSSKKSRDAYKQQFNIGQRTLLDLLDSEVEVYRSNTALIDIQYSELFAEYRILNSMGVLLQKLNVSLPETLAKVDTE